LSADHSYIDVSDIFPTLNVSERSGQALLLLWRWYREVSGFDTRSRRRWRSRMQLDQYQVQIAQPDATNAGGSSMMNMGTRARTAIAPTMSAHLGAGSWVILIVLVGLLFAACVVAYLGWRLADGVDVPISGYVAMVVGVIASRCRVWPDGTRFLQ
jgi:hypothetical protein